MWDRSRIHPPSQYSHEKQFAELQSHNHMLLYKTHSAINNTLSPKNPEITGFGSKHRFHSAWNGRKASLKPRKAECGLPETVSHGANLLKDMPCWLWVGRVWLQSFSFFFLFSGSFYFFLFFLPYISKSDMPGSPKEQQPGCIFFLASKQTDQSWVSMRAGR